MAMKEPRQFPNVKFLLVHLIHGSAYAGVFLLTSTYMPATGNLQKFRCRDQNDMNKPTEFCWEYQSGNQTTLATSVFEKSPPLKISGSPEVLESA